MATTRAKLAIKNIGNSRTEEEALVNANYSPSYARSGQIKKTKGWLELMNKFLNDDELVKKHSEQLNSSKLTKLYFDIDDDDEVIMEVCKKLGVELLYIKINKDKTGKTANVKAPDFFYRDLALDKAYKVKQRYSAEGEGGSKTLIINITGETAQRYNLIKPNDATA